MGFCGLGGPGSKSYCGSVLMWSSGGHLVATGCCSKNNAL